MSLRIRDLVSLYVLAVLVNGSVALLVNQPGYADAYYYFNGGQFIAEGRGFVEPYIWNYVNAPRELPAPAFGFWQPLSSLLVAAGILMFRWLSPFDAAQVVFVALTGLLPVLAYEVAVSIMDRRKALIAGLLMVFSGYYVPVWSLPETFTPFALSAGTALFMMTLAKTSDRWQLWPLIGVCGALANLTRADGVLIPLVGILIAFLPRRAMPIRQRLMDAGWVIVGFILVMAPWYARNWQLYGSVQAPGGISTLWLTEYNDLFNYPQNLSLARFWSTGIFTIASARLAALGNNLMTIVAVVNLIFLIPFTIVGLWSRWRQDQFVPAVVYGVLLFAAMTFAFPTPGVRGGLFHSAGALLPFVFAIALLGLDDALRWIAARRRWHFEQASQFFRWALVGFAILLTGYLTMGKVLGLPLNNQIAWNATDAIYVDVRDYMDKTGIPTDGLVMSVNTPGFYYHTGRGGVPVPNGNELSLLKAADGYGVRYVVLDANVTSGLESMFKTGPQSPRLKILEQFGPRDNRTILYEILPTP